ncbi:hypothetical protein F183_A43980 [Bryobacterales bacterium F-183]|nr:hypothetical protein F183_A43980 [Bryobacterales bacterium F-183]
MGRIAANTSARVREVLAANGALQAQIQVLALEAGVHEPGIQVASQLVVRNVAADLAEKTAGVMYPAFFVYCDKISNSLREKFRTFSGTARMVVETRASQDRLEGLEDRLHIYADAVMSVLDAKRGDWGQGMFYTGGYEVAFGPVKHGGKHFIQTAKVVFDVEISAD